MQNVILLNGRGVGCPGAVGCRCRPSGNRAVLVSRLRHHHFTAKSLPASGVDSSLDVERREQSRSLERIVDGFDIDSLAALGFHEPDDIRGLVASEPVRSTALVTVPIRSTLAVAVDDGGHLTVLAPPELPTNVKKAVEAVAELVRGSPDPQLLILAVLLLWARKYGSAAWQEYCAVLLPPPRELSCLLSYSPGELRALQLPHLVDEASRQHDWGRWAHSQWLSSSSGALRRLGLASDPWDTTWALAAVRSRAVEFRLGGLRPMGGAGSTATYGGKAAGGPFVSVLAPVVDLANHSSDPNCVLQLTTDHSRVVLLPRRPICTGEPLTVDYGYARSSLELMVDYGFVTTANPHDGEVPLPEADKLPPLELGRLERAARKLQRRWRSSGLGLGQRKEDLAAALGWVAEVGDGVVEVEVVGQEEEAAEQGASKASQEEREAEAWLDGRIRAAISLLAPRCAPSGSTPATQRITAGLWHKLVRHCADSFPTSLEQDWRLLEDMAAGRVSGFACGLPLGLDPTRSATVPLPPPEPKLPPRDEQQQYGQGSNQGQGVRLKAQPAEGEADGGSSQGAAPRGEMEGRRSAIATEAAGDTAAAARTTVDGTGRSQETTTGGEPAEAGGATRGSASATPPAASPSAPPASQSLPDDASTGRSGRRVGRLYAAVRARIEYKELLAVAEALLLQYARN